MSAEPGVLTYLTDAVATPAGDRALCVGDAVVLRQRQRGGRMEAWSETGLRLGALPPAESEALAELLPDGADGVRGHIAALIPRPQLNGPGRIHIRVLDRS